MIKQQTRESLPTWTSTFPFSHLPAWSFHLQSSLLSMIFIVPWPPHWKHFVLFGLQISYSEIFFRSLQCDRLRVHKNFMVSLVLLYLTTIIYFEPYTHHSGFIWYKSQPWLCNSLLVLLMFCFQSPIFWMFIEGIYLHSRVSTNIFNSSAPFSIYYLIGWGENLHILPPLTISCL